MTPGRAAVVAVAALWVTGLAWVGVDNLTSGSCTPVSIDRDTVP